MKIINNRKGSGYIELVIAVLVIVFLLVLAVSVWSAAMLKQEMRYICQELIDTATISGRIGSEVDARFNELCAEAGFTPEITWEASYYDATTKRIQLGDTIQCTLSHEITLQGFGSFTLPFPVTVTKSGLSRVYWK